jgi:hypothetical protein
VGTTLAGTDAASATPTTRRNADLASVFGAWAVSRLLAIAALRIALDDPGTSWFTQLTEKWDGIFYLVIGRAGYGPVDVPAPRWPFFPGFPALIRVFGEVGQDTRIVFVVNQLAFLVALVGLYRLARRHTTPRGATIATWSLALFPASFVFSLTYPSAIFLAATVWGFLLVEQEHDVAAGLVVAVAAIVRPNGIVVALSLLLAVKSFRRALVVCGPAAALVISWCWYCYDRTGDALVFLTTKSRWDEITLWQVVTGTAKAAVIPHAVLAAAAITIVVLERRRLPRSWVAFTALYLLPSLVTGMAGLGRYANECFPPFVAFGQWCERISTRLVVASLAVSAGAMCAFAYLVGHSQVVP